MILLDANILLYLHSTTSPQHDRVREWFEQAMDRREDMGLPWQTIVAFLRISTNPRAYAMPLTLPEAAEVVDGLLSQSNVFQPSPTVAHWAIFREMLSRGQANTRLVSDAHLAALAIEHGAELCTHDRDFLRFPGLKIVDPVQGQ